MARRGGSAPPAGGSSPQASWMLPAAALGTVVLLDLLRVWLPSVIFVFGRAGSTPATTMAAFAFGWFAAGVALSLAIDRIGPGRVVAATSVAMALARLALQGGTGGQVQLYVASVGVLAGILWLAGLAAGSRHRHVVLTGITLGFAGDVALRAALYSVELTWIDGVGALVATAVLLAAFVGAAARAVRGESWDGGGPAWVWLAVGPAVALLGILSGSLPRAVVAAPDWPVWFLAGLLVAAHALAVALALYAPQIAAVPLAVESALLLVVGTVIAAPADASSAVLGQVLLASGLAAALGALGSAAGSSSPRRRALAAATGMLLLFGLAFPYYAAYDLNLGIDNRVLLYAAAALLSLAVLVGARGRARHDSRGLEGAAYLASATAAVVLLTAVGAGINAGTSGPTSGDGYPVRVMTYNVHMGYDTSGRFDAAALSDVIASTGPDVVVLNEVDRGWLLNGGHDVLGLIAHELDLPYVFAPAADEVWGNAILSRYPVGEVRREPLPREGVPMRRGVLGAVIEIGGGQQLAVIATHLHHVEEDGSVRAVQAGAVVRFAASYVEDGRPTLVLGDLNATPGAPDLAAFRDAGFVDLVEPLGPIATFPSWSPDEQIDHVLGTPGLAASDLDVPASEASDHLGVAVTVSPRG